MWMPFSAPPIGATFEPEDTLYGYTPLCTKVERTSGIGSTHMGRRTYIVPSETYVRVPVETTTPLCPSCHRFHVKDAYCGGFAATLAAEEV